MTCSGPISFRARHFFSLLLCCVCRRITDYLLRWKKDEGDNWNAKQIKGGAVRSSNLIFSLTQTQTLFPFTHSFSLHPLLNDISEEEAAKRTLFSSRFSTTPNFLLSSFFASLKRPPNREIASEWPAECVCVSALFFASN
jgi:hypothetical protein